MSTLTRQDGNEELWHTVFAKGHPVLVGKQRRYQRLPGNPRCKLCEAPFGGIGGWLMRRRGLTASERNPQYCTACDGFLDAFPGGAEVPMSMMMVDIRGSVELSGRLSARDYANMVIAMRDEVAQVLDRTDGFLLEFQGDSVFAVWPPGFVGEAHAEKALRAAGLARQMIATRGEGKGAPIGVAVHTGEIFIGTVSGAGGRLEGISAFGLEVNVMARLAAAAAPGEVLVSAATYAAAGAPMPEGARRTETLKGVEAPVEVAVL
ncbi:MAG: adenylate/guanylate cyclase domain-containing protein [Paracoccus sp. (in: a-proteobacteria)]|uniref:adenylate/guanylate cyclase domain-containing protein n=1 Tax=Paracoccus sp. TaxID=267 RepID=UPI0039196FA9